MINFYQNCTNQWLFSPKISEQEKFIINELKDEFEKKFGLTGYFLIMSSGSSQKSDESVRLIALSAESVLNSAARFNNYFKVGKEDRWGLVLPEYHVAGLAVYARAFLVSSQVLSQSWSTLKLHNNLKSWIIENKITYMSMVPAQIFDIVHQKIKAPDNIKKIFVGAAVLNSALREQALQLGWPIVETYGMTETASMVAVKEGAFYKLLPGVDIQIVSDLLSIKCNSLFTASLQKRTNQIKFMIQDPNSWFQTEDRAESVETNKGRVLKILERDTEYIKILGMGVSLKERRDQFLSLLLIKKLWPEHYELLALEDERAGFKLVMVSDDRINLTQNNELINLYNKACQAYERICDCVIVEQIPRTELGKLKTEELKRIVMLKLNHK